ncbi:MAG TPA: hypothetical protein PLW05_04475 [Candidatus Marinimicrobia bacterium]|nr:hypothetical protein [Candidatus Neomarinimicrobiota bacterium]HQE94967.1 hypothetical protein [Candidatus Neomarinimicrobiota bacterium]HQH55789.1 hypothetical protein [Candidatus Neomarinimicrobiota bacterium]
MMIILKILLVLFFILIFLLFVTLFSKTWLSIFGNFTEQTKTGKLKVQLAGKLISIMVVMETPEVNFRIGILGLHFKVGQKKAPSLAKKKSPEPKPEIPKKPRTRRYKFSIFDWIEFGKALTLRFFKLVHIETLSANLTVGLGNPAYTGLLMGAYYTIRETVKDFQSVHIVPDFVAKKFTGKVEFRALIRLIKTIPILIFIVNFLRKMKNKKRR